MYTVSIPVMLTAKTFDADRILADLRFAGASRVFLAIPPISTDRTDRERVFEKLAPAIRFFKQNGIETGVWFWAFMTGGQSPFTRISGFGGKESAMENCPADPDFLDFAAENLAAIAAMSPDLIMFDDDLRLGFLDSGCGCLCRHHKAAMRNILGEELPEGDLFRHMFSGGRNRLRSAYLRAAGESLKTFCRRMRAAVDSVSPSIRLGACSCMTVWDTDGVDSYTLAKLLAGKTRPFLRLIGAPYWAENRSWGNRLEDVIEINRMERSWYDGNDIEIFSEGDSYPRPRYRVPASYLEIFDTALRADGRFDGIHKYMLDYTSSTAYERGYLEKHAANRALSGEITRLFAGKSACGVRVYEALHKLEDADFTGNAVTPETVQNLFFPTAARFLAENSIPTVYTGSGCAGIAFGENARHLPENAFEKPLVLDMQAAQILTEHGVDVGLRGVGGTVSPTCEHYPAFDGENTALYRKSPFAYEVQPDKKAVVHSFFVTADRKSVPACYTYTSPVGGRFCVYTFNASACPEEVYRNYCRPRQLTALLDTFGAPLPAVCHGNPDLYLLCKSDETNLSLGLWNCHADYASQVRIRTVRTYTTARFVGCTGYTDGNTVIIDRIGAYEYAFVQLSDEKQTK